MHLFDIFIRWVTLFTYLVEMRVFNKLITSS